LPDQATRSNRYEIAIPKLASLYLTHDWNGEVKGLDAFGDNHPPVAPVFWAFRIMVGTGMLMLLVSWFSAWRLYKGRDLATWQARVLVAMTFSGWLALVAGWYVTEIGRQPWLVYGVLTTAQAASQVPAANIALTLSMYLVLYGALLTAYVRVVFYLARKPAVAERPLALTAATPTGGKAHEGAA
jgi:cytochrome d ubiquinol oxidase subunit I